MTHRTTPVRRLLAAAAAAALVTVGLWGVAAPATADVPDAPATEFTAGLCDGTTLLDPTDADGAVPDLALVFGQRLVEYNAGQAVILYDAFGANDTNAYPAVCGVRYVEGVGPVSEWMFCTDYYSHVCSGVDADGNLLDFDGNPIPGLDTLDGRNEKLSADQEKLIAYLVQNGSDTYDGVGYFSFSDASRAVSDGDSWERSALQILVWCISDPVTNTANATELERQATCEANMSAERQTEILAGIPEDPTLTVAGPAATLEVGETAEFTITTDVFTPALTVTTGGAAGSLTVLSGPGVLTGDQLQITGSGDPVSVVLGYLATEAGTVDLDVSAEPTATSHIGWNQSPGLSDDGRPCQVFATFHVDDQVLLTGAAAATFAADSGADVDADADAGGADAGAAADATAGSAADGTAGSGADGTAGSGADGTAGSGADGTAGSGGTSGADGTAGSGGAAGSGSNGSGTTSTTLATTGAESVSPIVILAPLAAILGGAVVAFRLRRTPATAAVEKD